MEKLVTYVEQTIPILSIKYWTHSQSRDSLYSSNQSDQSLNITSESDETVSTSSYYTGVDQESADLEKESLAFSESSEGGLEEQSHQEQQDKKSAQEDMALEINGWKPANEFHRDLPCLKIIIDDFDKQKPSTTKYSINSGLEESAKDGENCTWHDISEQHVMERLSPTASTNRSITADECTIATLEHVPTIKDDTANVQLDTKAEHLKPTVLTNDDLEKLKLLADRLKLQTRRGSYTTWKDKLVQAIKVNTSRQVSTCSGVNRIQSEECGHSTVSRELPNGISQSNRIQEKLDYIRSELQCLRDQDVSLARQFMSLRNDIQQMRLQHSSWAVEDMVDAAQWTIAETAELKHVWDEPRSIDKTPLLTVGVTKMNLTERRFSVF